ncbi:MAG TPA: hypothetical protein VKB57_01710 [Acidimicrobiales bacterium]|nr:hypothetical protein [Acidimicrobiales bacterium]
MRRMIGAVAMATLVGLGAVALPTTGAAAAGRVRTVQFSGTSVFDLLTGGCSFAQQSFDATLTTKRGDTLHIEGCADATDGVTFPFTGTFTIQSPGRRGIAGTVSGTVGTAPATACTTGVPAGLDFELTPVRETRRPHDTAPPLELDGVWCSPALPRTPGPISGTLTGVLPPGL